MSGTGKQVGSECYSSNEVATDHVMSLVVPVIAQDGTLHHPVKQGAVWHYNGQPVSLTLPDCDPMEQFNDGLQVGIQIIVLMFVAMVIKLAIRILKLPNDRYVDDD